MYWFLILLSRIETTTLKYYGSNKERKTQSRHMMNVPHYSAMHTSINQLWNPYRGQHYANWTRRQEFVPLTMICFHSSYPRLLLQQLTHNTKRNYAGVRKFDLVKFVTINFDC